MKINATNILIFQKPPTKYLNSTASNGENVGYKYSNATLLSKITFWWMTPLLWKGYGEPLELEDLGTLPEDDTSRSQYDQFLIIYQSYKVS